MNTYEQDGGVMGRLDESAEWPYASLLVCGFFGSDSPEGKRLTARSAVAAVVAGASLFGLHVASPGSIASVIWGVLLPLSVVALAVANVTYLASLDDSPGRSSSVRSRSPT